jgi:hypothetical protein
LGAIFPGGILPDIPQLAALAANPVIGSADERTTAMVSDSASRETKIEKVKEQDKLTTKEAREVKQFHADSSLFLANVLKTPSPKKESRMKETKHGTLVDKPDSEWAVFKSPSPQKMKHIQESKHAMPDNQPDFDEDVQAEDGFDLKADSGDEAQARGGVRSEEGDVRGGCKGPAVDGQTSAPSSQSLISSTRAWAGGSPNAQASYVNAGGTDAIRDPIWRFESGMRMILAGKGGHTLDV